MHRRSHFGAVPWRLVIITAAALSLSLTAGADDWPQRRGIGNDGISRETSWTHQWPAEGPKAVWKGNVGIGFSAVVVGGGKAFTSGNSNEIDTVWGLDATTGRTLWSFSYPEPLAPKMYEGGPNSTPTLDGNALYVASKTAQVFRLDPATGSVVWSNLLQKAVGRIQSDWGIAGSPLVVGSKVYFNVGTALVALDKESGKLLWSTPAEEKGKFSFTTPILWKPKDQPLLLVHLQKALHTVHAETGKELNLHPFGSGYETHSSDPVVWGTEAFISSADDGGELLSFEASEPSRRWKNKNLSTFTGNAVLKDGFLYGVDAGGYRKGEQNFRCVDWKTGEIRWSLPGFGQDSWILAGDRVLLLRDSGELRVIRISPEKGEIVARAQVTGGKCWTQPTLSNGLLYLRNARGSLLCLDLR